MTARRALRLAPGAGLVVRRPAALLFTAAPDPALVDAFAARARRASCRPSRRPRWPPASPSARSWAWRGTGVRVMAFGDVAVETDQPSLPMLSGAGSRTWVEHTVLAVTAARSSRWRCRHVDGAPTSWPARSLAGGFRLELGPARRPPSRRRRRHRAGDAAVPVAARRPLRGAATAGRAPPRPRADPGAASIPTTRSPRSPRSRPPPSAPTASRCTGRRAPPAAPRPSRRRHSRRDEHHDPDVTLPPPASEALLADVRARRPPTGAARSSTPSCAPTATPTRRRRRRVGCAASSWPPASAAVVHVPRPSLGRLQLDDGELVDLDQELLIGRNPDRDEAPAGPAAPREGARREGVAQPPRGPLPGLGRPRRRLRLDERHVRRAAPRRPGLPLEPGRPQMIDPGAVVYFGSRSFTLLGRAT